MDFSSYKACLFDVDHTLTNSKREISDRTKLVLQTLVKKGVVTGLCTGRHFATLNKTVVSLFSADASHIVSGGSQIINSTGAVIEEKVLQASTVKNFISIAEEKKLGLIAQVGENLYANTTRLEGWSLKAVSSILPKPISDVPLEKVPILVIDDVDPNDTAWLQSSTDFSAKIMQAYDKSWYADVTPLGINKAAGIARWCTITGIKAEEIIGFGDSENDAEFLQVVGYSVAVGNAVESIKQIVDEVTTDCDHDGVAEWIERNLL